MFPLSFQTTLAGTLQILLMGGCGYFLTQKKIIDENGLNLFSRLVVNFFLPAFILSHLLSSFSFSSYPNWWWFPLISFGINLTGFALAQLIVNLDSKIKHKREFVGLISFQNSGYLPLILVATLLPATQVQTLYIYIFLFLIGFDLLIWSLGVWLLTRHKIEKFELKQIMNGPITAITLSLLLVYFGLNHFIPDLMMKPVKMFGDCTLPLSMIIVGGNLARLKRSDMHKRDLAAVLGAKLVILPLLALLIVTAIPVEYLIGFLIVLEAAVPSATTLSVIARHYELEDGFLNQGLVLSHLVSIITIPVFLMLYFWLKGV